MTTWYIARGAGLSALVLLSLATCLGALVSRHTTAGRRSGDQAAGRRYVVQYVHRAAAGLGLAVLMLHLGAILADSYAGVGWRGALVPFTSGWEPTWVGLGSLAAYLFVGVALLGLVRGRMAASPTGVRVWRGLHGLAYLGWVGAMWHGFVVGSDTDLTWVTGIYVVCLVAVLGSVSVRLTQGRRRTPEGRFTPAAPRPAVLQGASR